MVHEGLGQRSLPPELNLLGPVLRRGVRAVVRDLFHTYLIGQGLHGCREGGKGPADAGVVVFSAANSHNHDILPRGAI